MLSTTKYLHQLKRLRPHSDSKNNEEDRISQLPDCVLHQILALLATKQAAKTRILSKRWDSVWTSIPVLNFGEPNLPCTASSYRKTKYTKSLMNFIDSALLHRNHSSTLRTFHLCFDPFFDLTRVYSWLSYLFKQKVQHLDLSVVAEFPQPPRALPSSLFTCRSLTVFELLLPYPLKLPTIISLPSLKILSFVSVVLSGDFESLICGCPVLEELHLRLCTYKNINNTLKVSSLALKILGIHEFNSSYTRPNTRGVEIHIFAPNIHTLELSGNVAAKFRFFNLSSLVRVSVEALFIKDIDLIERGGEVQQLATKFFEQFSNAKVLQLYSHIGLALFKDAHRPPFENVTTLSLRWKTCLFDNRTLLNMLQVIPNLKNLYIYEGHYQTNQDGCFSGTTLPVCLLLCLNCIEIDVNDGESEVDMISFLLENGKVLEKMVITLSGLFSTDKRQKLIEQFQKIPICSPNCRVVIR